jgi:hypothetical protein
MDQLAILLLISRSMTHIHCSLTKNLLVFDSLEGKADRRFGFSFGGLEGEVD